jgi:hypothetical protein
MTPFQWFWAEREHEGGTDPLQAGTVLSSLAEPARRHALEAADRVKTTITNYPAAALGTAFLTGVVLGWLIKRR